MENNKIYWKGLEELTNDIEFVKNADKEFPEYLPIAEKNEQGGTNRRDFLKLMGFGVAAVSLAACETPVKKAIPYLNKPEDIDPSIANFYASTYFNDGEYASILVKTREGRPINIKGNEASSVSKGIVSAKTIASVLGLYDLSRLKNATKAGKNISWEDADKEIITALQGAGKIYLVTSTIISPSTKAVIAEFSKKYDNVKVVSYDAVSAYGILKANEKSFGVYALPTYNFSKADVVVSVGADFQGTWLNASEYASQFAVTRKLGGEKKDMSRHYQFESGLSISGANADYRIMTKPSQEGLVVAQLYNEVAKITGGSTISTPETTVPKIRDAAKDLVAAKGKSLVISGSNDVNVQVLVNALNTMLGNYGNTLDMSTPSYNKMGNDEEMAKFVEEVKSGSVGAVFFYGTNPVYDYPKGGDLAKALANVKLTVSFSDRADETSSLCQYICPDSYYLESWGDAQPRLGNYSLIQPAVTTIFKTRQAQDSLLVYAGKKTSYYDYLRAFWKNNLLKGKDFENAWIQCIHDGVLNNKNAVLATEDTKKTEDKDAKKPEVKDDKKVIVATGGFKGDIESAASSVSGTYKANNAAIELSLYTKNGLGNGSMANNPWLQELPDPITKATWDNYACISKAYAAKQGLKDGDVIKVTANGVSISVPVLIQPGQDVNTISIALGYGRTKTGKCGDNVGKNAFPFSKLDANNALQYGVFEVSVAKTQENSPLARTQTHQTIMGRHNVQESKLSEYQKNPKAGRFEPMLVTPEGLKKPTDLTLWDGHEDAYNKNHWWGLAIDLNSCTGCGACVVGCQVENNVPVVGKAEVINAREMHWMRIDRYYSTDANTEDKSVDGYKKMEEASANPEVVFQPMMCQHCNNAPCETVCPVVATTHSSEGLNQMTYNRCIGTRYCANNCPFKVRRFNWFNYTNDERFTNVNFMTQSDLGKMVLNPDVTTRSRGVMEKCSLCVQRIQAGKLNAKKDKRKLKDGEVTTACQDACPTGAITFGDINNAESVISKLLKITKDEKKDKVANEPRAFYVLEEINVKSNVAYLTKIRNKA
jgi:MoCo/4Fe-4S cofactor protein with predicted Tat translocation signal